MPVSLLITAQLCAFPVTKPEASKIAPHSVKKKRKGEKITWIRLLQGTDSRTPGTEFCVSEFCCV